VTARPTVVFDFDGTLALGSGPLEAYIRTLADLTGSDAATRACREALEQFEAGTSPHRDAYDAVRTAALAHGITDAHLSRAYLASREQLGTESGAVSSPAGLVEFLTGLSEHAALVLATNAPNIGVDRALSCLGIAALIDERHHDVGKPAGLAPIIAEHLRHGPVLSVGDIWEFDLAPAAQLGADTALVGVRDVHAARPTFRGVTLTDLYDDISAWTLRPLPRPPAPHDAGSPT
jgi:FMN phosphatase YigB (HAD superfamily)